MFRRKNKNDNNSVKSLIDTELQEVYQELLNEASENMYVSHDNTQKIHYMFLPHMIYDKIDANVIDNYKIYKIYQLIKIHEEAVKKIRDINEKYVDDAVVKRRAGPYFVTAAGCEAEIKSLYLQIKQNQE